MKATAINIKILAILSVVILITGCEKFLEIEPQGELTKENFPTTASDALLATNAAYSSLREWHYSSGGYPILDIMSDDARKGSNPNDQGSNLIPYDVFSFTTTQDGLSRWWNALYLGIKRTNVVIEKIPDITMDEALKTRYIAEARFIRGLMYFDLVRAWGGVPLVENTEPPLNLVRSSSNDIYNFLINDLIFAEANLPLKSEYELTDLGRATKGAAQALLARVYLFSGEFAKAATHALDVINSGMSTDLNLSLPMQTVWTETMASNQSLKLEPSNSKEQNRVATNMATPRE